MSPVKYTDEQQTDAFWSKADLSRITPEERKAIQDIMRPRIQAVVAMLNSEKSTTDAKCKEKVRP